LKQCWYFAVPLQLLLCILNHNSCWTICFFFSFSSQIFSNIKCSTS
jgi:hypothetical protein